MSDEAVRWAVMVDAGSPGANSVLRFLADKADETNFVCASRSEVTAATAIGAATVGQHLYLLKARGALVRWEDSGRGPEDPSLYLLGVPDYEADAERHLLALHSADIAYRLLADAEVMRIVQGRMRQRGAITLLPEPAPRRMPAFSKDPIPAPLRWAVFERDEFTCQMPGCGSRRLLEADHIIPESRGGPTLLANLQTFCGPCNRRKASSCEAARV